MNILKSEGVKKKRVVQIIVLIAVIIALFFVYDTAGRDDQVNNQKMMGPVSVELKYDTDSLHYKGDARFDLIVRCIDVCTGKTMNVEYVLPDGIRVVSGQVHSQVKMTNTVETSFPVVVNFANTGDFVIGVKADIVPPMAGATAYYYAKVSSWSGVRILTEMERQLSFPVRLKRIWKAVIERIGLLKHRDGMGEAKGPADEKYYKI